MKFFIFCWSRFSWEGCVLRLNLFFPLHFCYRLLSPHETGEPAALAGDPLINWICCSRWQKSLHLAHLSALPTRVVFWKHQIIDWTRRWLYTAWLRSQNRGSMAVTATVICFWYKQYIFNCPTWVLPTENSYRFHYDTGAQFNPNEVSLLSRLSFGSPASWQWEAESKIDVRHHDGKETGKCVAISKLPLRREPITNCVKDGWGRVCKMKIVLSTSIDRPGKKGRKKFHTTAMDGHVAAYTAYTRFGFSYLLREGYLQTTLSLIENISAI